MAYITIKTNTDEGLITLQERVVPGDMLSDSIAPIWSSAFAGPSRMPTSPNPLARTANDRSSGTSRPRDMRCGTRPRALTARSG